MNFYGFLSTFYMKGLHLSCFPLNRKNGQDVNKIICYFEDFRIGSQHHTYRNTRISGSGLLIILSLMLPRSYLASLTSPRSHFDIAWPKLWYKNGVFCDIFGCSGSWHLLSKNRVPIALEIFCTYAQYVSVCTSLACTISFFF